MGYTNYWLVTKEGIPEDKWNAIATDVQLLLVAIPALDPLGRPLNITREDSGPDIIRFGGGAGCEEFSLEPHLRLKGILRHCKTRQKPYDLVVCGVLIVAAKHAQNAIHVYSDGEAEDWLPALEWVQSILGPEFQIPIR